MYTLATDLKHHPRGSAAGTTTDPRSCRTMKREFNPESYRMNEKGDPGYLFVLPTAQSSSTPDCLVYNLKLSVDSLLFISPMSSSYITGRSMISSSFPLR